MSMQRGCVVIELNPSEWYCVVATEEHDYDFKNATVYGPCKTEDAAVEAMSDREPNPGGYNRWTYDKECHAARKQMIEAWCHAARTKRMRSMFERGRS